MNPPRYMLVDERYPVKRRPRGARDGNEPAVTLLPPDPYLIMERPDYAWAWSPTMYRTAPPKSAKNKEASSFVILGETMKTPVQSRPGSPSGRVSPFRGHGFKSPTTTRPNSRVPSPSASPKKTRLPPAKSNRGSAPDRPRIGRDIGLPPKSPAKIKSQNVENKSSEGTTEKTEIKTEEKTEMKIEVKTEMKTEVKSEEKTESTKEGTDSEVKPSLEENKVQENAEIKPVVEPPKTIETEKPTQQTRNRTPAPKQRLPPPASREKKSPVSPIPKTKTKPEGAGQSVIKKTSKPPIPPKKLGLKTTLKAEEGTNEQNKKNGKPSGVDDGKSGKKTLKTTKEVVKEPESEIVKEVEKAKVQEGQRGVVEEGKKSEDGGADKGGDRKQEKLIPCFQPDKCQIAPPTMASPSPIITPTISTPSTTADLAPGPTKNSQSIAAAPTTVTPSTLSSVSSTVVLTGNLARKEIENRNKSKEPEADAARAKETKDPSPPETASVQMVKAASRDSIKWSKQDSLSGEITSTTKVIKAEPEMEVLSPNNLRDSPPRMPPPNVAWDEGRLPNGDVASKAEPEGRFRRFLSAVWRFLSCLAFSRCCKTPKCCQRSKQDGATKPSIFSRMNCCKEKSCRNPFRCCAGGSCCCKPNCEGRKCCRKNSKPGGTKPKPRKCCAKPSCKGCCDGFKARCLNLRNRTNNLCRSLFCLNLMCCQNFLRKFKFCHKLRCCQKDGFCSCCNPNVKKEAKKLNKKGSRASNNSKDKDNLDVVLVEHTSLMKAAIPVLPSCLAVFCLILNLFVPGFGTLVSGILCLCFGKPRFSVKDTPKNRLGSFIVNTIIAVAQLFTVIFCLVGWGWSVWWGVIMYKLSRRQKRLKLAEKNQKEAEGSNVNHNHVDVEQG